MMMMMMTWISTTTTTTHQPTMRWDAQWMYMHMHINIYIYHNRWNSTLAVTYPARKQFHIQRGDSFDTVAIKSQNQCYAIHLPVIPIKQQQQGTSTTTKDDGNDNDEHDYNDSFVDNPVKISSNNNNNAATNTNNSRIALGPSSSSLLSSSSLSLSPHTTSAVIGRTNNKNSNNTDNTNILSMNPYWKQRGGGGIMVTTTNNNNTVPTTINNDTIDQQETIGTSSSSNNNNNNNIINDLVVGSTNPSTTMTMAMTMTNNTNIGMDWGRHDEKRRRIENDGIENDANGKDDAHTNNENENMYNSNDDTDDDNADAISLQRDYDRVYRLSIEEQTRCLQIENGTRRGNSEGKACLERYRLASRRIFSVVLQSLTQRLSPKTVTSMKGKGLGTVGKVGSDKKQQQQTFPFILEKASVDEFYLDVTEYCYSNNTSSSSCSFEDHQSIIDDVGDDDNDDNNVPKSVQYHKNKDKNTVSNHDDDHDGNIQSGGPPNTTFVIGEFGNGEQQEQQQKQQRSNNSIFNTMDPSSFYHSSKSSSDPISIALQRACLLSYNIRSDLFKILGFTMSAGISTNKMMAKLAASYGKPNGQAVLHPQYFPYVMETTKMKSVRNFGGKLGKAVVSVLSSHQQQQQQLYQGDNNNNDVDVDNIGINYPQELRNVATMDMIAQIPLPVLESHFSHETAQFIFEACQGIDNEPVKSTLGALVKSITAFKSFPPTKSTTEVRNWFTLMTKEIVDRVRKDTERNHRYPKSCTLNFTCYKTQNGKRPVDAPNGWRRNLLHTRSVRLNFPPERDGANQKCNSLVQQAMIKLMPILKDTPLRGVGLSASNFEVRGRIPGDGMSSIQTFFPTPTPPPPTTTTTTTRTTTAPTTAIRSERTATGSSPSEGGTEKKKARVEDGKLPAPYQSLSSTSSSEPMTWKLEDEIRTLHNESNSITITTPGKKDSTSFIPTVQQMQSQATTKATRGILSSANTTELSTTTMQGQPYTHDRPQQQGTTATSIAAPASAAFATLDIDVELAKKLQASFDRENYVLATTNLRRKQQQQQVPNKKPKFRPIETFFLKRL
jgi:nucleotidyltransferase/DNA polymerase involved in DNA repair